MGLVGQSLIREAIYAHHHQPQGSSGGTELHGQPQVSGGGSYGEGPTDLSGPAAGSDDCGLSFTADTPVATPDGERAIASLQVVDQVEAYDPATQRTSVQTVQHVYIDHDSDRVDVTLRADNTKEQGSDLQGTSYRRAAGPARGGRSVEAAIATDDSASRDVYQLQTQDEVVETTSRHPWLAAGLAAAGIAPAALSGRTGRWYTPPAWNFASRDKEVLLDGYIPPEAISPFTGDEC
jgi:hypothetical protein